MRYGHGLLWGPCLSVACALAGCAPSEGEGQAQATTSAQERPAADSGERGVLLGSLQFSGDFAGNYAWNRDLALSECTCMREMGGRLEATMTDGAGGFITMRAMTPGSVTSPTGEFSAIGNKIGEDSYSVQQSPGHCSPGEAGTAEEGDFDLPIDLDLQSTKGKKAHVKGHLTIACPSASETTG